MQNPPLKNVHREFDLDLPDFIHMDECVTFVLGKIEHLSRQLHEQEYFIGKRWLEVRDDNEFQEMVLHIFNEGGEYLVSIDGDIHKGNWRFLKESNTLITEYLGKNELYDLAFLNEDFFVLLKHGNQTYKGQRRYLVLGNEEQIKNLNWRSVMDKMLNIYRSNSQMLLFIFIGIVIIAIIAFFNFF